MMATSVIFLIVMTVFLFVNTTEKGRIIHAKWYIRQEVRQQETLRLREEERRKAAARDSIAYETAFKELGLTRKDRPKSP